MSPTERHSTGVQSFLAGGPVESGAGYGGCLAFAEFISWHGPGKTEGKPPEKGKEAALSLRGGKGLRWSSLDGCWLGYAMGPLGPFFLFISPSCRQVLLTVLSGNDKSQSQGACFYFIIYLRLSKPHSGIHKALLLVLKISNQ